ncbi:MAG: acyl-CoA desaturase [Myxococcales bacterium]|nr:acyl-CoA desaturase [Myxococcales bacterium]|tara:strand:- start:1780 stop:2637 length:858 start_codon:yes stop_codon:yes gene_type:complete
MTFLNVDTLNRHYQFHRALRWLFHLGALWGLLHYSLSFFGLVILALNYLICILSITVGYHRYFSHKAFQTSRLIQFAMACLGCCQLQGGPIAWSAVHRHHHRFSDEKEDLHSPVQGFYQAHMGWLLSSKTYEVAFKPLKDLTQFKELVWLDRYNFVPPVIYFALLWLGGFWVEMINPAVGIDGLFLLFWGGILRTVVVWHATWSVNSVCHLWGQQPHQTHDNSKNNLWIALLVQGEGWHNNHHKYPSSARNGMHWLEPDVSYGLIWLLERVGLVWRVRRPHENSV